MDWLIVGVVVLFVLPFLLFKVLNWSYEYWDKKGKD
jgi:hypothetical protein